MIEYRLKPTRNEIRFLFALAILAAAALIVYSYAADPATGTAGRYVQESGIPYADREPMVGPRNNTTVVAGMDSPFKQTKALYAFDPQGRLAFYANRTVYGDVDPTADRNEVIVATHSYFRNDIAGCDQRCTHQYITRVNLSTGTHRNLYRYNTPGYRNTNWHDVDHLGGDRYLIAGIRDDSAWVVNVSTGLRTWQYDAQRDYPIDEAGPYPEDWTHLNDVEAVPSPRVGDGNETWYMLDLRNQDQVVFVDPDTGLKPKWTLGCEDCHDVLFEQHNPDYIPRANGGPSILVADSENNRVVEYHWTGDGWVQSWQWQDDVMSWPRDADRLPNGHTLITDSHGSRVIEVNRSGAIVWQARIVNGYDAERLGTGDESAGGPSAVRANLTGRDAGRPGRLPKYANEMEWEYVSWITKFWHMAQFVFPVWVTVWDLFEAAFIGLVSVIWAGTELYWRGVRVRRPWYRRGPTGGGEAHVADD